MKIDPKIMRMVFGSIFEKPGKPPLFEKGVVFMGDLYYDRYVILLN